MATRGGTDWVPASPALSQGRKGTPGSVAPISLALAHSLDYSFRWSPTPNAWGGGCNSNSLSPSFLNCKRVTMPAVPWVHCEAQKGHNRMASALRAHAAASWEQ